MLRDRGFVVKSSLKNVAKEQMKISYPNLNEQRNILKEGKNKVAEAITNMVTTPGNPFSGQNRREIIKDLFNYKLDFDQDREERANYKLLLETVREYLPKDTKPGGVVAVNPIPEGLDMQMKSLTKRQQ